MSSPVVRRLWIVLPLALLLVVWIKVGPWVSGPGASAEEIARTWAKVEAWADAGRQPRAPLGDLDLALGHLRSAQLPYEGDWRPTSPPLSVADDEAELALAALVDWAERAGGLGDELCIADPADPAAKPQVKDLARLARLAIRSSVGVDEPKFAAGLRLGAYLRERGPLLAGLIGFSIAREALAVARARGQTPGPAFVRHAPRREEVLSILAREAVCSLRMAEATLTIRGSGPDPHSFDPGLLSRWATGWAGPGRELAMARWYFGQRVEAAAGAGDDLNALAATQRVPPGPDALPASLLVRALVVDGTSAIGEMNTTLAEYASLPASPG